MSLSSSMCIERIDIMCSICRMKRKVSTPYTCTVCHSTTRIDSNYVNISNCAGNQIETNRTTSNATIQNDMFQSPFFPNFYPRDLSIEHIFTCDDGLNQTDCTLEVTFSDFQISFSSSIEVSLTTIQSDFR